MRVMNRRSNLIFSAWRPSVERQPRASSTYTTIEGSMTQTIFQPSFRISPARVARAMWSTSPLSNAPPSSRRTSVRRVIGLDVRGRVRGAGLEGQHGPEEVRADRGQGEEPFHAPDEGKHQDDCGKVAADEAVEDRLDKAPPFRRKSFPHPGRSLDHHERRDVAEHREPSQEQGYGPPIVLKGRPGDTGVESNMDDVIEHDIQLLAEGRLH